MRTRNANNPKSAGSSAKKTPPPKKAAAAAAAAASAAAAAAAETQTPSNSAEPAADSPASATETKRTPATRGKQAKAAEAPSSTPTPSSDATAQPAVEEAKLSAEVTPEVKPGSGTKTKRVVRKVVKKTVVRAVPKRTPKSTEAEKGQVENVVEEKVVDDEGKVEPVKEDETVHHNVEEPAKTEEPTRRNVDGSVEEPTVGNVEGSGEGYRDVNVDEQTKKEEELGVSREPSTENVMKPSDNQESIVTNVKPSEDEEYSKVVEDELKVGKEERKHPEDKKIAEESNEHKDPEIVGDVMESQVGTVQMDQDVEEIRKEDAYLGEAGEEKMEGYGDEEVQEQHGQDDFAEGDGRGNVDEAEVLEEERAELDAAAKERKLRKELEIFVGGLERDATEEDIKKVFEYAGEVVEVRLHKDPSTNKNKGYAFVRFTTKEQASRALSEMKNPVIRGKRCGTAPTEDNDTLFLGNICNTWTKEAIRQKLKDYGIEGVERITLVADPRHEGLSRGFAFLEFSSHGEAMCAYKRLQKPDVIFGHTERTAKVAFAEPLREPNPEVMAQVKSVFIDGLPPYWDEDRVREKFKDFGEIARIMLARNMSTAKRKDFGFVDFTTHEAAVACVEGINNAELGDGNSKTKVRARLSNPLPKTQAVKGGMCGGFRIGRGIPGTFPKFGRGFGRGGYSYNRATFQHGRGFYPRGPGQGSRMDFPNDHELDYPPYHGRQSFGRGGRWGFRGAHQMSTRGPPLATTDMDRPGHGAVDRGLGDHDLFRGQTFPYEGGCNRPFMGRNYDDPYLYDDIGHGGKRPFFMTDPDTDYMEPSRFRARLDYSGPPVNLRGNHYRDAYGTDTGPYSQDYYGPDYGGGAYPSSHGASRPYPSSHGASRPYPSSHGASRPYPSSHGASRPYGRGYYY